jgi:hypothetical protein
MDQGAGHSGFPESKSAEMFVVHHLSRQGWCGFRAVVANSSLVDIIPPKQLRKSHIVTTSINPGRTLGIGYGPVPFYEACLKPERLSTAGARQEDAQCQVSDSLDLFDVSIFNDVYEFPWSTVNPAQLGNGWSVPYSEPSPGSLSSASPESTISAGIMKLNTTPLTTNIYTRTGSTGPTPDLAQIFLPDPSWPLGSWTAISEPELANTGQPELEGLADSHVYTT